VLFPKTLGRSDLKFQARLGKDTRHVETDGAAVQQQQKHDALVVNRTIHARMTSQ